MALNQKLLPSFPWGASWAVHELQMRIMNVFLLCPDLEQSADQLADHWFSGERSGLVREALNELAKRGAVEPRRVQTLDVPVYRLSKQAWRSSSNSAVSIGLTR